MKKMHLKLKHDALHRDLGVPEGQKIPLADLAHAAAHSQNALTRKRAQFALNARHWHHARGK